jgi:hypothetical protein
MEEITVKDVVFMKIINEFPTDQVERNLSAEASLRGDLGLKKDGMLGDEIFTIAMSIEQHYQEELDFGFHIPDESIKSWETVQDIINTLSFLLNSK